ncbi:GMC family oxidoreductase [Marinilongibacter aquaticus]|uniref:GMC oxidoreductase n=1 Tax=Marinilongibacter aquaticus TaxID=2975157 RepID=UPI0021BD3D6E|nr:GMC family oxidoreductase [Marinilongibacter aquaticus]UBM57328.1 GMC family oxidoreductase [Marinilongibacter aquaticus]
MIGLNDTKKKRTFDAIVVGSGISGGWAAKELAEKGLKTLILERGPDVKHIVDYPTAMMQPWDFPHGLRLPLKEREENPIASKCYIFNEDAKHFVVKDKEHPYVQEKPFDWIRGYQVGGKSLLWARETQRWSQLDFDGPARDGYAVEWPIGYKDIAPWYSYVEKFAGITGNRDGLEQLPDGEFLKPFEQSCVGKYFDEFLQKNYKNRRAIIARKAHITDPQQVHYDQGRAQCQHRRLCQRGCPLGGYFSSNASTIPWALKTGNCTLRADSVVDSIIYDEKKGKAVGVKVIDRLTKKEYEFYADIIFVNAAAMNTTALLLNSTSSRFPEGLGNDSGVLGKYVAFHNYRARVSGQYEGMPDTKTEGGQVASSYMPRWRNLFEQETDFIRGYAAGFGAGRRPFHSHEGIGEELKQNLVSDKWGPWYVGSHMMGETIPKETNFLALDRSKTDEWGIPLIHFNVDYDENDEKMVKDYLQNTTEMFEKAGFTNIRATDSKQAPGLDIHEMGGARMGKDPKTSMLNKWNQVHSCKNVFVTDGACMTSTSTQNPSLTYMAFAARSADYAVEEMKKGNL